MAARKGEGSIYPTTRRRKDADGKVREVKCVIAELRWTDPDGIGQRRSLSCANEREAKTTLAKWKLEIASMTSPRTRAEETLSVKEAVRQHIDSGRGRWRSSTLELYGYAKAHLDAALGSRRVVTLRAVDIRKFLDDAKRPASMRVVARNLLRAALRPYVRLIKDDLFPPRSGPKSVKRELVVWSRAEARRFLATVRGEPFAVVYETALATGMRQGEILGLRWSNVCGDHLVVGAALDRKTRSIGPTKTSGSQRRIDIPPAAIRALAAQKKHQKADGIPTGPNDLVFTGERGGAVHARNMYRRSFLPLVAKAKVPRICFHDMRHVHATLLLAANVHPKIVSERLGHSSIRMTLDRYSHLIPTMQQPAVAAIGKALGGRR